MNEDFLNLIMKKDTRLRATKMGTRYVNSILLTYKMTKAAGKEHHLKKGKTLKLVNINYKILRQLETTITRKLLRIFRNLVLNYHYSDTIKNIFRGASNYTKFKTS